MIERGEKIEEYRAIKPYWICRLLEWRYMTDSFQPVEEPVTMAEAHDISDEGIESFNGFLYPRNFEAVCFSYGYTKRRMTFECKGISIGRGKSEWGAPEHEVFIIKLGKRLYERIDVV